MKKNLLLIYPPMDKEYYTLGVNDSPPLGLVVLQNYVQRRLNGSFDIMIIDGEHKDCERIVELIQNRNFDLVGLQPMMASYKNSLRIAEEAKKTGAITLFGGHHSTQLAANIITNQKEIVDFIVVGDGEKAFLQLIEEEPVENIPNLVYWDHHLQKVIWNRCQNVDIQESLITYFDPRILSQYSPEDYHYERGSSKSFRSFSHKGCKNRTNSQYCFFCGRADRGSRFKPPEFYLQELNYLATECGAEYIFEIGDDFLQDEEWLGELVRLKTTHYSHIQTNLKIFARSNRVTPSVVELLKKLNVDEAAIGFESGSERILERINKNATSEQNIRAAELLFANGIDTIASYVLGLPGEDDESLEMTREQALSIRELSLKYLGHPPHEIIGNLIEINPGSHAYSALVKAYPEKYRSQDMLSIKETQDDYFRLFFDFENKEDISSFRKQLAAYSKRLNSLGLYSYPAGWNKEDMEE